MTEILEIIVLLSEFPDGIILGKTRPFAINFFKKNYDLYEIISEEPLILRRI